MKFNYLLIHSQIFQCENNFQELNFSKFTLLMVYHFH